MKSVSEKLEYHIQRILCNDPKQTLCSYAGFGWSDEEIVALCDALKKK